MWIATSDGWLSIVKHLKIPNHLLVRARKESHIVDQFPAADVYTDPDADYPYRANIHMEEVAEFMVNYVENIDYPNFKNSIPDNDFYDACTKVWSAMYHYGTRHRPVFEGATLDDYGIIYDNERIDYDDEGHVV